MRQTTNIDKIGIITSGLCAIHCLAIPVLLSFGVMSEMIEGQLHGAMEWAVYGIAIVLASLSFYKGYKIHGSYQPGVMFVTGFLVVSAGLMMHHIFNHWLMGLGGLILAIGHYMNHQMQHQHSHIHIDQSSVVSKTVKSK